jgi:hypothetical protein
MKADQTMDTMAERLKALHNKQAQTVLKLGRVEAGLTELSADLMAVSAEMHEEAHELANITTIGRSWRVFLEMDDTDEDTEAV